MRSSRWAPTRSGTARRQYLLKLLAAAEHTADSLRTAMRPRPSIRTLAEDLRILRESFPERLIAVRAGRQQKFHFLGEIPHVLAHSLASLDEDQVAALIAARGLLQTPSDRPADMAWHGTLARAIDRLLHDVGLHDEANRISPDTIAISRFGAADGNDFSFGICFAAIRAGAALHFTYTNLNGKTAESHVQPIRLISISGEWHLLAWAEKLKQYRLSRMDSIVRAEHAPPGCPHSGLRQQATDNMRDAFRATGSTRSTDRIRIVLALSPTAWPFIEKRRWGSKQIIDEQPTDLPPGWRRLSFTTTGLREARHWVLSFGRTVRAESPPELIKWLHAEAREILTHPSADEPL